MGVDIRDWVVLGLMQKYFAIKVKIKVSVSEPATLIKTPGFVC